MGLYFENHTNRTVYVAYAYPNFGCGPVNYAKIGWYPIEPGRRRLVWNGYAGGNTFYYYAEDGFGRAWTGRFFTDLPRQTFHWCWNARCATCRYLGMRGVAVPILYYDFTIRLVVSGFQRKPTSGATRYALPTGKKAIVALRQTPKLGKTIKRGKGKPITTGRVSLFRKKGK